MTETESIKAGARTQHTTLQYRQLSRCWYAEANLKGRDYVDEISFGLYSDDQGGGCEAEGCVKWYSLDTRKMPSAHLEIFDDGWKLLAVPGFAKMLASAHGSNPSPEEFCDMLKAIGFSDDTEETKNE